MRWDVSGTKSHVAGEHDPRPRAKVIEMRKAIPVLFCTALVFSEGLASGKGLAGQTHSSKGKRLTFRIAQILGFKTADYPLPRKKVAKGLQTLMTAAVACTMLACGAVKPHLYSIGLLNLSSAMQAQITTTAVLAAQRDFDHEDNGTAIIHNHVYAVRSIEHEHKTILAEVVKTGDGTITLQVYADEYELTIDPSMIEGYLIDDHPNVGRVVKLTSDAVGISHLNGDVFAVYNNGIHAINITSKTSLNGEREELHEKDDAPHIRFAYESQLQ